MSDLRELLTPDVLDRLCNVIYDGVFDGPEEMNEALRDVLVSALAPLVPTETFTEEGWALRSRENPDRYYVCETSSGLISRGSALRACIFTVPSIDPSDPRGEPVRLTRTVTVQTEAP